MKLKDNITDWVMPALLLTPHVVLLLAIWVELGGKDNFQSIVDIIACMAGLATVGAFILAIIAYRHWTKPLQSTWDKEFIISIINDIYDHNIYYNLLSEYHIELFNFLKKRIKSNPNQSPANPELPEIPDDLKSPKTPDIEQYYNINKKHLLDKAKFYKCSNELIERILNLDKRMRTVKNSLAKIDPIYAYENTYKGLEGFIADNEIKIQEELCDYNNSIVSIRDFNPNISS